MSQPSSTNSARRQANSWSGAACARKRVFKGWLVARGCNCRYPPDKERRSQRDLLPQLFAERLLEDFAQGLAGLGMHKPRLHDVPIQLVAPGAHLDQDLLGLRVGANDDPTRRRAAVDADRTSGSGALKTIIVGGARQVAG